MNGRNLFAILTLVLLITTIIFGVRSVTNGSRAAAAEELGEALVTHIRAQEYPSAYGNCTGISPSNFERLRACLIEVETSDDYSRFFTQDAFRKVDEKTGEPGHLVIKNERGTRTFESGKFILYRNNEAIVEGCTASGEIAPGYTCRFDFVEQCGPGDNLEVRYDGNRAFLKTC